ncbi:MAG: CotH kinase family protein [Bacteroides sp.]|nr:CotH kinase family protein [Bacteroides sp.]
MLNTSNFFSIRNLRPILTFLLTLCLVNGLFAQTIDHWETMIQTGDSVKYLVPESELPSDWSTLEFDDSMWTDGISGIGYGDGDDSTEIDPCISVYIRYSFSIPDISVIERLLLDMDFDDGFVAYLNGSEIARENIGTALSPTSFDQPANGFWEAGLYDGQLPFQFEVDHSILSLLVQGDNVFSIEVHNENAGSSDLSSNAFLHAGINVSSTYFNALPDWFSYIEPLRFSSELPVLMIDTEGGYIVNDPRIIANMGIIDNGPGLLNHPDDAYNHYDGKISIEIRGSSSRMFPKKSYSIETQTDSGTNNNVALLGMPSENDWVLHAPYSDKSLLRNVLSYEIYERMGHWSPRTRYVDLYLNNEYQGIYVLTEKVKRDKNRVDIAKITEADVSEVDISGGYILQYDRTDALSENEFWTSPVGPIYEGSNMHFEYSDPSGDELSDDQSAYIRNWVNELDAKMSSSAYKDELNGYKAYMDVESFVDYLIFHEFNKDVDAYRLSAFFYKENDRDGGLLHAGPPWDYNLTYGNMDYGGDIKDTYNWLYTRTISPYWWRRLMDDPWFENEVFCRWEDLSAKLLNVDQVIQIMDSSVQVMASSIDYNFEQWPVLGEYVWPNFFIAESHEEEIDFMHNWVSERLIWMDQQWGDQCVITGNDQRLIEPVTAMQIFPNPSDLSHARVQFSEPLLGEYQLTLFDLNGRQVYKRQYHSMSGSKDIDLEDLSYLSSGIYLLKVAGEDGFTEHLKVIKN